MFFLILPNYMYVYDFYEYFNKKLKTYFEKQPLQLSHHYDEYERQSIKSVKPFAFLYDDTELAT